MSHTELKARIEEAASDPDLLAEATHAEAVYEAIEQLDRGELAAATREEDVWRVHAWVQQAVLLYFRLREVEIVEIGPFEFSDKIPLKKGFAKLGVRVVPPGTVRYGAFVGRGSVIMPGYVNIGARVGEGSMVDTWATVGSCAQVGSGVHLSGGVGIGGVLEPPGARPVIVEDGAFIGSRCIVVEGVQVEKEAVLGANVVLTASTPVIDVTGAEEVVSRGRIPARSVVVPGMRKKQFPAGEYLLPCALIIGRRKESTDLKTSLNDVLRDFSVAV
jgi:2,3,4,5-tetrahydropyridine-2,6-dicarboxylate N-succinyltransferase